MIEIDLPKDLQQKYIEELLPLQLKIQNTKEEKERIGELLELLDWKD